MTDRELRREEELALIRRAAQGDHEAFGWLVMSYEASILAFLGHMLHEPELARDVAQETFIALFHALPRWHPAPLPQGKGDIARPLAPLLYKIATNQAISFLRKPAAHVHTRHTQSEHEQFKRPPGRQFASSVMADSFEEHYNTRELLHQALQNLPEDDAACLLWHFVLGERYGDIAARLGVTREAVRKRISRAVVALRKAYIALDTEVYS